MLHTRLLQTQQRAGRTVPWDKPELCTSYYRADSRPEAVLRPTWALTPKAVQCIELIRS